jgi:hypothetical protein
VKARQAADRMSDFHATTDSRQLGRVLHASCECSTLDERDAVIDALRPLVEQGWQIDLTYSLIQQPTTRHVTLGVRADVFDHPSEPVRKTA